jgi:16S rRNA (cytosine1402-N4)-methyltransferase
MNSVVLRHVPVMLQEVLHAIRARATPPTSLLDCTFGFGGHTAALLERFASIRRAVAFDRDEAALERAAACVQRFGRERLRFVCAPFGDAARLLGGEAPFDVVLADLGFASSHVDDAARGFSFALDAAPLDMRFSQTTQSVTAAHWLNERSAAELAAMLSAYADERLASHIAAAIVERRASAPFGLCRDLADLVFKIALRHAPRSASRTDRVELAWQCVRRVFQALRIAVNDELRQLDALLAASPALLADGGTLLVISFHSLEHDAVKRFIDARSGRAAHRDVARLSAALAARSPGADPADLIAAMRRDGNIKLPERRDAAFTPLRVRKPAKIEIVANRRATSAHLNISTRVNNAKPTHRKKAIEKQFAIS